MATDTDTSGAEAPVLGHHEVADASPALARQLRQGIAGCHWSYATQMLDIIDWVCPSERQHDLARKRALDLINGQERAMQALITRTVAGTGNGS